VEAGLGALALTDHDTTAGLADCAAACAMAGVAFVPGIEISADRGKPTGSMHILGYFIDPANPELAAVSAELERARNERAPQIVEKLNALGVEITMAEIIEQTASAMIGRPHIAAVLKRKGYVGSVREAFERYIGQGAPAFVRKDNLPTERAIAAIHAAGGLAVLAHPIQLRCADDAELEQTVRRLADEGLDGLEVYHSDHSPAVAARYGELAAQLGLLVSGGSDYHGEAKSVEIGSQHVPAAVLERLREGLGDRATKRRRDGATEG
jgi:predicted metal-dependent phosphoesterase TrpH